MNISYIWQRLFWLFFSKNYSSHANSDGATLTGGAGAWAAGTYATILAASTATNRFKVNYVIVESMSVTEPMQIDIATGGAGSEVIVTSLKVAAAGRYPVNVIDLDKTTRISARLASKSGGADTAVVSVEYSVHY